MKILLTGGAGFIGSHLCERLLKEGHSIVCIDNFNDYYDPNIKRRNISNSLSNPNFELITGDIMDLELIDKLFKKDNFDIIIHLAAMAGVRSSIEDPYIYHKINNDGTLNLLEKCKQYNVKKFVFASSSSVYGNNTKLPASENDPTMFPVSIYATTKKTGELTCYTYHHLFKLDIVCLRFFTVYGPRQRPEMAIHKFTKLLSEGNPVPMFGDGKSIRDYTYIDDIIDGTVKAMYHVYNNSGYHIYNLGRGETNSLIDTISFIAQALKVEKLIDQLPMQPGDVDATYADISKAKKEIGYNPHTSLKEGIYNFIEWFKKNN